MKRQLGIMGIAAVLLAAGCQTKQAPAADVWAMVNGKEIRRDDVEKAYRSLEPEAKPTSDEEILSLKLNILDQLVLGEILLERARTLGVEASDGEVEDKFTERKSPFTEEEFQRQLDESGLTVDDVKRELRRQLSIQKLINREVVSKIAISDTDIGNYYNENRDQFNITEALYRIAQIVVTPVRDPQLRNRQSNDATNAADARRKADMLMERINSGADFEQLAMDFSEDPGTAATGGNLGIVPESAFNQAAPQLKRTVLQMRPGDVATVNDSGAIRIIKLMARELPGQRDLNDPAVRENIRSNLRNRQEQLLRNAYLSVARNEANVVNYLARQVLEAQGKLPSAAQTTMPPAAGGQSGKPSQPAKQ